MAGNVWSPEDGGLQQILQLLRESQSPDNATQRTVQQVSFRFNRAYNFYYMRIIRVTISATQACSKLSENIIKNILNDVFSKIFLP